MGLIRASVNALRGTLQDQYKEVISCNMEDMNVLVKKGRVQRLQGSTNNGRDDVITDGSLITVEPGQCMIVVEDGKILDFTVEQGPYIFKTGTSPSMLTGGMDGLKKSFTTLWNRIQTGGQQDHIQRVYYINRKEIMDNNVGFGSVPFRDSEFNFTITLQGYGKYSYQITDPLMFFANVCGPVEDEYRRSQLEGQLKMDVQDALEPALGRIAIKRIPYDRLNDFKSEVKNEVNREILSEWVERRGISIVEISITVNPTGDSKKKIEEFQTTRVYTDARMMGARLGMAQSNAMESAAKNENGAMMGFMGMGMAQQAGGMNAAQFFQMGQQPPQQPYQQEPSLLQPDQPIQQAQQSQPQAEQPASQAPASQGSSEWTCSCGTINKGKFCLECGSPKPAPKPANVWTCSCGAENTGKFCQECGNPMPKPTLATWKCVCGAENTGKFCSECGRKPLDAKCETCGYEADKPFKFCPECGAENKI